MPGNYGYCQSYNNHMMGLYSTSQGQGSPGNGSTLIYLSIHLYTHTHTLCNSTFKQQEWYNGSHSKKHNMLAFICTSNVNKGEHVWQWSNVINFPTSCQKPSFINSLFTSSSMQMLRGQISSVSMCSYSDIRWCCFLGMYLK